MCWGVAECCCAMQQDASVRATAGGDAATASAKKSSVKSSEERGASEAASQSLFYCIEERFFRCRGAVIPPTHLGDAAHGLTDNADASTAFSMEVSAAVAKVFLTTSN